MTIGDTTGSDKGDLELFGSPGHEHKTTNVVLSRMAGTLEAVDGEHVGAHTLGTACVTNGGALVDNIGTGLFDHFDDVAGVVAGGLKDAYAFVESRLGIANVVGRIDGGQKGDVDGKRAIVVLSLLSDVVRDERVGLADGLAKSIRRGLSQSGEGTESTSVADGGGEGGCTDPLHAALNQGDAQAELFSERSDEHVGYNAETR